MVDALSFKEAEDRIIEELKPFTTGNLEVKAVKRVRISEIFDLEDTEPDMWYRVKCEFITIDEKTDSEKTTTCPMLVHASSFHDAVERFDKGMHGSMVDYRIVKVEETKILDVFKYKAVQS